jgi:two-component system, cell cycle response regulator
MTRILTVDDSRAIRSIVSKQVADMGFDLDEAEDGEQGLLRLAELSYDLVILDVTMPVLDGPGMLRRMRERGDKTAVLMLTSESKRSIIADCMKLGIEDYILKPFKPEELRAKVTKILPGAMTAPVSTVPAPVAAATAAVASAPVDHSVGPGKQFIDLLLVDDMENVQKKLRTFLPAHISLQGSVTAQSALSMCRERVYRVILVDTDIPEVNSAALMNQLRMLQPHAACLALTLRSVPDADKAARSDGYDDLMFKPFQPGDIEDFLLKYFDNQEILEVEDNLMRAGSCPAREDRVERYYRRLAQMMQPALEKVAAACYDDVIFDMSKMPLKPDATPRLIVDIDKRAQQQGLRLRLVGSGEGHELLKQFSDTASMSYFPTVTEARSQ